MRRAADVTLPAFIASMFSSKQMVTQIISDIESDLMLVDAVAEWSRIDQTKTLMGDETKNQKTWDQRIVALKLEALWENANAKT